MVSGEILCFRTLVLFHRRCARLPGAFRRPVAATCRYYMLRRDLPPRRNLLVHVVVKVRLVCLQWHAARVAVLAAVCACCSAWTADGVCCNKGGQARAAFPSRARTKFFAVCCSPCLCYLFAMASGRNFFPCFDVFLLACLPASCYLVTLVSQT